jgi:hypothetical protein
VHNGHRLWKSKSARGKIKKRDKRLHKARYGRRGGFYGDRGNGFRNARILRIFGKKNVNGNLVNNVAPGVIVNPRNVVIGVQE